jgi:hypothetical protein
LDTTLEFCHQHNLVQPDSAGSERRFGIRVTLPSGDTFVRLVGESWETIHWYASEMERDAAYDNMATRHGYNRSTDNPSQILEKIIR